MADGNSLSDFNFFQGFWYWFLPTLFFCSTFNLLLSCFVDTKKRIEQVIVLLITIAFAVFCLHLFGEEEGVLYSYIRIIPVAFCFYELGNFTKKITISLKYDLNGFSGIIKLMLLPLLVVLSQWNEPVKMYIGYYGSSFVLFLLSACIGIGLVIVTSKIANMKILRELGRLSIALYVWNFIVVGFTKGLLGIILEKVGLYTDAVLAALSFAISVIILYGISKITLKFTPFIYGQKKNYND